MAFLADAPLIVALLAVVLGAGSVGGRRWNLWGHIYRATLARYLDAPEEREHPAPPRFAMTLGFLFLTLSATSVYLLPGITPIWLVWGPVLVVSILALLAAASGLCLGCKIYLRVLRFNAPSREVEA